LILYGEEATKKAQREGEEAVATYERQLKDGSIEEVPKKEKNQKPKKSVKSERRQNNLTKEDQLSLNLSDNMEYANVKKVRISSTMFMQKFGLQLY
jgi:hypothetical protein